MRIEPTKVGDMLIHDNHTPLLPNNLEFISFAGEEDRVDVDNLDVITGQRQVLEDRRKSRLDLYPVQAVLVRKRTAHCTLMQRVTWVLISSYMTRTKTLDLEVSGSLQEQGGDSCWLGICAEDGPGS